MSNTYFVELLTHSGEVAHRYKFNQLPVSLGRAYRNDVILDDQQCSPDHAVIDCDDEGLLRIQSRAAQSNIRLGRKTASDFKIQGDDVFLIGATKIRIRTQDYVVSPQAKRSLLQSMEGWPLVVASLLVVAAMSFVTIWIGDTNDSKSSHYLSQISAWLVASVIWAGLWAIANRVFGGRASFSWHLLILVIVLLTLYGWDCVTSFFAFAFSLEIFTRYGRNFELAIFVVFIYFHLVQISPHYRKRFKFICAGVGVCIASLMLFKNYQDSGQFADELYMRENLPPSLRMSPYHSLDELDNNLTNLKQKVAAVRVKALKDKSPTTDGYDD